MYVSIRPAVCKLSTASGTSGETIQTYFYGRYKRRLMNIQEQIREYIVENILFGDGENLQPDTSFQEEGIMDSMGILGLISFIEETYDITIKDDDLTIENLGSVQDVSNFVQSKLKTAQEPEADAALIAGTDRLG